MELRKQLLSSKILYILIAFVYGLGLFIPLMENDSAQHATMAMDMYLRNDFSHLFKAFHPYLDKPHLHFWLAAISFKIFGVHAWAYRVPALLFTLLGAFSCFKIAKLFYGNKAAKFAPLIFLTAQAIVLANHDVRTDAVLTGATIFSIWQLISYFKTLQLKNIVLGAIGLGMAFASKGQLGVFVIGCVLGIHLLYERNLKALLHWKLLIGILVLAATISPVLYAYYVQFGTEGIQFILWDQSFNRMTAKGFTHNNPDHLFFFHTLLWAFLPWGILLYIAFYYQIKNLVKTKFQQLRKNEIFSSIGVLLVLAIISTSKTKLPHYLNSILPVLAILIAGYLTRQNIKEKTFKTIFIVQFSILTLAYLLVCAILIFAFPPINPIIGIVFFGLSILLIFNLIHQTKITDKLLHGSILFSITINFFLNTSFYPNLLTYQSGLKTVAIIEEENIPKNNVYKVDNIHTWSLDFYTERLTPTLSSDTNLNDLKNKWFYLEEAQFLKLQQRGLIFKETFEIPHYRVTRLTGKFLNAKTRKSVLETRYLVKS